MPEGIYEPSHLIDLANELAASPSLARTRTALNRFYYGTFLEARRAVVNKRWATEADVNNYGGHSKVQRTLKAHRQWEKAEDLDVLRRLREHADYHVTQAPAGECPRCDVVSDEPRDMVDEGDLEEARVLSAELHPWFETLGRTRRRN